VPWPPGYWTYLSSLDLAFETYLLDANCYFSGFKRLGSILLLLLLLLLFVVFSSWLSYWVGAHIVDRERKQSPYNALHLVGVQITVRKHLRKIKQSPLPISSAT
jgi:hypothetical protein